MKLYPWKLAFFIWLLLTGFALPGIAALFIVFMPSYEPFFLPLLVVIAGTFASLPLFIFVRILLWWSGRWNLNPQAKHWRFRLWLLLPALGYALPVALVCHFLLGKALLGLPILGCLVLSVFFSIHLLKPRLLAYWGQEPAPSRLQPKTITPSTNHKHKSHMEQSNKVLYKGIITAVLILLMLVPTVFISNLVSERKGRQAEVVREVSNKWAAAQTVSGYYLYLPYEVTELDAEKKPVLVQRELIFLPEDLSVSTVMEPEVRLRSIYKVLLYRSRSQISGQFKIELPAKLDSAHFKWNEARICIGINDIKGIEERLLVKLNDQSLELSPGLPTKELGKEGLSASLNWSAAPVAPLVRFESSLLLKGSEQLHFLPLAGNSCFQVESVWPSPSFDGNYLPATRVVSDSGFKASWAFNKANLPFGTQLQEIGFEPETFGFGITMVQPADQYAKTERSVKYAILFIGLTFSLFFIVELLQKKPVHPVQYVLIGLALSIFYALLLSISEFLYFDIAYIIAATATVLLISAYAKAHFKSFKTAALFGGVLTLLYVFTFILVRLEDTALLIGSLGLFTILALAMYASRKVNWYGAPDNEASPSLAAEAE